MSDEIIKVLDDLAARFGLAIDWSAENVLPYIEDICQRYIKYEIIGMVIWVILILATIPIWLNKVQELQTKYTLALENKKNNLLWEVGSFTGCIYGPTFLGYCYIVGLLVLSIAYICVPFLISDIIQLAILPELYIYENLLKDVMGGL